MRPVGPVAHAARRGVREQDIGQGVPVPPGQLARRPAGRAAVAARSGPLRSRCIRARAASRAARRRCCPSVYWLGPSLYRRQPPRPAIAEPGDVHDPPVGIHRAVRPRRPGREAGPQPEAAP